MLTNEILSSIDNIDDCVMEAEMNVISALCNEYDKAIMIMENYNGDSYDCFDIFMEADESTANNNSSEPKKKGLLDGPIRGSKGENIIKRILLVIPRLIATLVRSIKKKWDNRKSQQLIKKIEQLENLTQEQKKQLSELQEGLNETNQKVSDNTTQIHEMGKNNDLYNKSVAKSMDDLDSRLTSVDRQIKNLQSDVGNENTKSHQMSKDLRKVVRVIDFMNGIVKTTLNFDTTKSYLQNILKMIETLEKFNPYKPSSIGKDVMNRVNTDIDTVDNHGYVLDFYIGGLYYNESYAYKFGDFKKYVKEITVLRDQITDKGSKLVEKMTKITSDVQKAYEGTKETKARQDTIHNCQTLLKYAQQMVSVCQQIDTSVTSTLKNIDSRMTYIDKLMNEGLAP